MSRIKSKNSKIEVLFGKELRKSGFKYKKNSSKYFGKPDFTFPKLGTVVFLDSCFWHGCKKHCRIPKTRRIYWLKKIKNNVARDKEVTTYYKQHAWKIFRIWEHEIAKNPEKNIQRKSGLLNVFKKLII